MLLIRNTKLSDWEEIMEIYAGARRFMRSSGNPTQWGDTYPPEEIIREEIRLGHSYVCEMDGRIQAVFSMIPGEDPFYRDIEGEWLNDAPYAAVHRVASRGEVPRLTDRILTWSLARCGNIRIDTHDDNLPMQRALARNGFIKCGRMIFEDGTPRIVYQKILE